MVLYWGKDAEKDDRDAGRAGSASRPSSVGDGFAQQQPPSQVRGVGIEMGLSPPTPLLLIDPHHWHNPRAPAVGSPWLPHTSRQQANRQCVFNRNSQLTSLVRKGGWGGGEMYWI